MEIEEWRTRLEGLGAQIIDGMPKTHGKRKSWVKEITESIQKRIDRLEMEIEEWRTRLEGLGAQIIDGMPKTHGKRKSWVKEITEIERLDDELTKELLKLRNKRLAIIASMECQKPMENGKVGSKK